MNELFKKSYEELREAFVRNRFAERQHFGREDIEEWLEQQRQATRPYLGDGKNVGWKALITAFWSTKGAHLSEECSLKSLLGSLGYDIRWNPTKDFSEEHSEALEHLLWLARMIDGDNASVFLTGGGIIVLNRNSEHVHFIDARSGIGTRGGVWLNQIMEPEVAGSLLMAWQYAQSARKESSRGELCAWGERCVAVSRKRAEHDFDKAVAVSSDGTKIIHADEVWVYSFSLVGGEFHTRKLPISKVSCNKVLRCQSGPTRFRWSGPATKKNVESTVCYQTTREPKQFFLDEDGGRSPCFVTHEDFVPDSVLARGGMI